MSARNWAWEVVTLTPTDGEERQLHSTEKLVLLCLAEMENNDRGYAFPSRETIALKTCLTVRSVGRALDSLASVNAIRIEKHQQPGGRWATNVYYLAVPATYRTGDKAWLAARAIDPAYG